MSKILISALSLTQMTASFIYFMLAVFCLLMVKSKAGLYIPQDPEGDVSGPETPAKEAASEKPKRSDRLW